MVNGQKIRISKFTQKTVVSYLGPYSYFLKWQDLWRPENTDVERRIQGEDSNNFSKQGNSPIPLLSLKKPWVVSETYSKRLNINRKPGPKASAGMSPWETASFCGHMKNQGFFTTDQHTHGTGMIKQNHPRMQGQLNLCKLTNVIWSINRTKAQKISWSSLSQCRKSMW